MLSNMNLGHFILSLLSRYPASYKLIREGVANGQYRRGTSLRVLSNVPDNQFRVVLSRLRARGLVDNKKGVWKITKDGLTKLTNKKVLTYDKNLAADKQMIISFDIPEKLKRQRNWLRYELRFLGFEMLQRSVWFGPAPLPENFIKSLQEMNMLGYIKFFESKQTDIV